MLYGVCEQKVLTVNQRGKKRGYETYFTKYYIILWQQFRRPNTYCPSCKRKKIALLSSPTNGTTMDHTTISMQRYVTGHGKGGGCMSGDMFFWREEPNHFVESQIYMKFLILKTLIRPNQKHIKLTANLWKLFGMATKCTQPCIQLGSLISLQTLNESFGYLTLKIQPKQSPQWFITSHCGTREATKDHILQSTQLFPTFISLPDFFFKNQILVKFRHLNKPVHINQTKWTLNMVKNLFLRAENIKISKLQD